MPTWSEQYGPGAAPTEEQISAFINNKLWHDLNSYLQQAYDVKPRYSYSRCSAQMGWNVKYQKSGKSLCTLYPMEGYFIALVVIGTKEEMEADVLIAACTDYVRNLYQDTPFSAGGRWLMINVTDQSVLNDVKQLISIRKPVTK